MKGSTFKAKPPLAGKKMTRRLPGKKLQAKPRILQSETYKDRIGAMWNGRGAKYDSSDVFHNSLALRLAELASVKRGNAVLDLATGTGMAALPVAQSIGKEGQLVGIDISESMLSEAEKKTKAAGLANCRFFQADVETTEFPMASFDVILCSSALLYLQDIPSALRQFLSWLKPGGRFCFNTPQEPCVPATAVFYDLLAEMEGIELADAAAPMSNADLVKAVCCDAGFANVKIDASPETILFANCDPTEYAQRIWVSVASNAIMTPLDGLVDAKDLERKLKPIYMTRVEEIARPWITPAGIQNPYTMLWVTAYK